MAAMTYHVTAKRWRLGWELHVDDVGVTQSHSLATAEKMVREFIALTLDIEDEESFDVVITPELPLIIRQAIRLFRRSRT
jgi:hypothetical protein